MNKYKIDEELKKKYEDEIKESIEELISNKLDEIKELGNKEEVITKANYLFNVFKILENYDELTPVLKKTFEEKYKRGKYNQLKDWDTLSK